MMTIKYKPFFVTLICRECRSFAAYYWMKLMWCFCKTAQHLMDIENLFSQTYRENIKQKLLKLCERERTSFDRNVLQYWNKSCNKDEGMIQIVETILAVPAAQVSMEHSFSALSTILTKLRSKHSILSNILITKLNYEILTKFWYYR